MFTKKLIVACFKCGKKQEVREFGATTRELLKLADWLGNGIGNTSAQAVISVIGTDMGRFPDDAHIASWAGLCPGNNESAKKRKSGKTRKGNALLRETLINCAHAAVKNKKSYFYAQFMRISAHHGKKRAYVAVAHSMLVAIYHILKNGVAFKDLGADYYNQFNKERKIKPHLKKLKVLGWENSAARQPA